MAPSRFAKYGVTVRLAAVTHERASALAEELGVALTDIVETAVLAYCDSEKRRAPGGLSEKSITRWLDRYKGDHFLTSDLMMALGLKESNAMTKAVKDAVTKDGRFEHRKVRWPKGREPRPMWVRKTA